jgi:hypothetical protein
MRNSILHNFVNVIFAYYYFFVIEYWIKVNDKILF